MPGISDEAMLNFYDNFTANFKVVSEKKVVVLVDTALKLILNGHNASNSPFASTFSKTSRKSLQGLTSVPLRRKTGRLRFRCMRLVRLGRLLSLFVSLLMIL